MQRAPLALAVAAGLALAGGGVWAQPSGMTAQVGAATLSQQGSTLVVTTTNGTAPGGTGHSSLNWQSFSIPAGTAVRFDQPSTASTAINRVTGGTPSTLLGSLSSNGRLVLVNTAGIAIGGGAVVDTAGFTASTVNASDAELLAGHQGALLRSRDLDGQPAAGVEVQGRILARHGDVFLVGGSVSHSGRIDAQAVALEGGRVVLRALQEARVSGEVIARVEGGARGGAIDIFGPQVLLQAAAVLDASGPQGGGQVRVGGDFPSARSAAAGGASTQAAALVPSADSTRFESGATIRADATGRGDGGQVVLWSEGRTESRGAISARGGPAGGDGGFVEVSGRQQLVFKSAVDTRAPLGRTGLLLLDPTDFALVAQVPPEDPDDPVSYLGVADLAAATSDLLLTADGAVTVSAAVQLAPDISLSIEAGRELAVNAPIRASGTGTVSLLARGAGVPTDPLPATLRVQAPITAAGIALRVTGEPGSVIDLQGAELLAAQGRVELTAPLVTMGGANWLWGAQGASISGAATLASGASLRLTGPVANGAAAAGRLAIAGLFTVQGGAQLRMAVGGSGRDQINANGGGRTQFADGSTLVLSLLPGAGRPGPGAHRLVWGDTAGSALPALVNNTGLTGLSLRLGSVDALLPSEGDVEQKVIADLSKLPFFEPKKEPKDGGSTHYEDLEMDCL